MGAASSLRYRPFPTHQDVRQFERLDCSESNSTVRFRSLFLPIRRASGADPSILKTRSRTDCGPTRGTKGWSAAGSSPLSLSRDTPQIGTPYQWAIPRNQARGLRRSPAPLWRGACLLVPTRSSFVTGTPAPPGDANREGTAFRGRPSDIPAWDLADFILSFTPHNMG